MSKTQFKPKDKVVLMDAPHNSGPFPHNVSKGEEFVVNYIDGCCLNVTGADGESDTLNQDRFALIQEKAS